MDSIGPPALVSGGRERGLGLCPALVCKLVPMPLFLSRVTAAEALPLEFLLRHAPDSPENATATGFGGRMNWVSSEQGGGPLLLGWPLSGWYGDRLPGSEAPLVRAPALSFPGSAGARCPGAFVRPACR